jgi:hypothetical protein
MAAVLAAVGLNSPAWCQQNISSSGNISSGQQQFQAVNFANATLAAPVSPLPIKNSQGSMFSNVMNKFTGGIFKSSNTLKPPLGPTTKSASAKAAAQVTKTLNARQP